MAPLHGSLATGQRERRAAITALVSATHGSERDRMVTGGRHAHKYSAATYGSRSYKSCKNLLQTTSSTTCAIPPGTSLLQTEKGVTLPGSSLFLTE